MAKRRYYAVMLDETDCINDEDLLRRCGGKVWTAYLYNGGEVTHLCELTPSYWLEEMGNFPDVVPEDDIECERLMDEMHDLRNDDYGIYVHCHQIDNRKLGWTRKFFGWFENMDEAREAYQANPVW